MYPAYLLLHNPPIAPKGYPIHGQWVGKDGRERLAVVDLKAPLVIGGDRDVIVGVMTSYPELTANDMVKQWQLPHTILHNLLLCRGYTTMEELMQEWNRAIELTGSDKRIDTVALVRLENERWAELCVSGTGSWQLRPFYNTVLYQNGRFLNKEALTQQVHRHHERQLHAVELLFTSQEPTGFTMPTLE